MSNNLLRRVRGEWSPSARSSRAASQSRTPMQEDSDDEAVEADFNKINDFLRQRLESLQLTVENEKQVEKTMENNATKNDRKQYEAEKLNRARIKSEATTPNEIIGSVLQSRTEVSTGSREILLAHFYQMLVSRSLLVWNEEKAGTKDYVDEDNVQKLINVFTQGDYRTATEFYYLVRSLVALIVSDIEDFGAMVTPSLLERFKQLVQEPANSVITNDNKATLINGFVNLNLILHHGSSNFGMDENVQWLMEMAEGFSNSAFAMQSSLDSGDREYSTLINDKDSDRKLVSEAAEKVQGEVSVATAALHGLAALLTLLTKGEYFNEIVEDMMFKLVPLVDNDSSNDIAKAAARVVAVIYEMYTYGTDDDEDDDEEYNTNAPYYEQESLFSIFERLANLSTKKVGKKEKKAVHSVFRNILNTMKSYVNPEQRAAILARSPEGEELIAANMASTHMRMSKYKSLPIDSWFLYSRLRELKWCFSFGLHNQLVANENLREILEETDVNHRSRLNIDHSRLDDAGYVEMVDDAMDKMNEMNDKKRAELRRKARENKLHENMGDFIE
ncbi:hypothetical protein DICA3_E05116 [Diutina catenulata]